MTNLNSKLTFTFSTTAVANRASVGICYEHISGYDLSTLFINDISESYGTLIFANKNK